MSSLYYTPRNLDRQASEKPKPPQARAELLEERLMRSRRERMETIAFKYHELVLDGKTNAHACRLIAEELGMGISTIENAVRWLKRAGRIQNNRLIKERAIREEDTQKIIERRNELALQGKAEREIASRIAEELGLKRSTVWYKIQQLIRSGKLRPKREISREARRASYPSPARGTMSEAPAPAQRVKKKIYLPKERKKPAEDPATTEFLMKVRRRVEKFVPIESGALREEHISLMGKFLKSDLDGKNRFAAHTKDGAKEYYFYLARTLRAEVQMHGGRPLFRESDIPGILFYSILENGNHKDALEAISDFCQELRDKKESFPKAVPFALELKIWVARNFCMENDLVGKHSEKVRRIRGAVDFSKLGSFLDYTQKTYPHMHPDESEHDSIAYSASWNKRTDYVPSPR